MKHSLIISDSEGIIRAAEIIRNGGLVVFPTETVYGLGADGLNGGAVRKIFEAKGRPADNPLIEHLSSIEQAETVAKNIPDLFYRLAEKFWPGPLTIVLEKQSVIPDEVTAGLSTVGLRIPDHPLTRELINRVGRPVAAPSANRSGRPSPTSFEMAKQEMDGRVDAIIDGGVCRSGLESTVISVHSDELHILRPGFITAEMLKDVSGLPVTIATKEQTGKVRSPGMKHPHYQPNAKVYYTDEIDPFRLSNIFAGKKLGLILFNDSAKPVEMPAGAEVINVLDWEDYAFKFYRALVEMDDRGVDVIIVQSVARHGLGTALMNRIERAGERLER